jgi:ubiquinone/menaquinone biosynthesis C-methylase UbiE
MEGFVFFKIKTKKSNIILTNHDARSLPFNKRFDLIILKNTLHHIPDKDQEALLKKLINISRQLIIVDIDDPTQSSALSKIWHWYYVCFLGDKGESFLTLESFKEKIKPCKPKNRKARFGTINTIKGVYFYCSVEREKNSKEVEIKAKIPASKIKAVKRKIAQLKCLS